jgi:hypothetical protein
MTAVGECGAASDAEDDAISIAIRVTRVTV